MQGHVEVKCISCGATKKIKPFEIPQGEYPLCDSCGMPMLPIQAVAKEVK